MDRKIPDSDRVNVFVTAASDGSISQCSVETVALNHYMSKYKLNRGKPTAIITYFLCIWPAKKLTVNTVSAPCPADVECKLVNCKLYKLPHHDKTGNELPNAK